MCSLNRGVVLAMMLMIVTMVVMMLAMMWMSVTMVTMVLVMMLMILHRLCGLWRLNVGVVLAR